jgi:hypothetical protein
VNRRLAVVAAAALACGDEAADASNQRRAVDYAGSPGTLLLFAPPDTPDDVLPLALLLGEGVWTTRLGADWEAGAHLGEYTYTLDGPLVVDGVELVPAEPARAEAATVYYGTFPDAVTTTVAEGNFAGRWIFARGLGPVRVAIEGVERELVYYEYPEHDSG